jgi:hypothetical protein
MVPGPESNKTYERPPTTTYKKKKKHFKEGLTTSNMNSDYQPAVSLSALTGAGHH